VLQKCGLNWFCRLLISWLHPLPVPALALGTSVDNNTFALRTLTGQLASPADSFCLFARAFFGGFLVIVAKLHLPEDAFPLHLLFEGFQRLIDVVVTDMDLHAISFIPGSIKPLHLTIQQTTQNAGRMQHPAFFLCCLFVSKIAAFVHRSGEIFALFSGFPRSGPPARKGNPYEIGPKLPLCRAFQGMEGCMRRFLIGLVTQMLSGDTPLPIRHKRAEIQPRSGNLSFVNENFHLCRNVTALLTHAL
jgi:hypothetical protein